MHARENLTLPNLTRLLRTEPLGRGLLILVIAVISLLSSPDSYSGGTATLILIATVLAGLALMGGDAATPEDSAEEHLRWRFATFAAMTLAVAVAIIASPLAAVVLLVMLAACLWLTPRQPLVSLALVVMFTPWWVWIGTDSWRWQLLMTVPMCALALIALWQLRDAEMWPADLERLMTARAHRVAAWMVTALAGGLMVSVGLFADVSKPWLALGGVILAAAIPLEAGFGSTDHGRDRYSVSIILGAFLIAIACWLIGVQ